MSSVQNTAGGPLGPDWLSKLEAYANRAADRTLDALVRLANRLDDVWESVARRLHRGRSDSSRSP